MNPSSVLLFFLYTIQLFTALLKGTLNTYMCGGPPKVYKSSNMAVCLVGGFGELVACVGLRSLAFVS
jgi:hypothetical protein